MNLHLTVVRNLIFMQLILYAIRTFMFVCVFYTYDDFFNLNVLI